MNDIINIHTHTVASGHAYSILYETASSAVEEGARVFGCSDHAPNMPGSCDASYSINFKVIPKGLHGPHLLMGDELNITGYEGHMDLSPFYLEKLDYTITSLHEPCYGSGTVAQNTAVYLEAIENPHINTIGHPDDDRFPCDYGTIVAAAREYHTLLEINSSSLHPKGPRPGARKNHEKMLELCRQYQAPIIIDSDAHIFSSVGDHRLVYAMLKELVLSEKLAVGTSIKKLVPCIPALGAYIGGE